MSERPHLPDMNFRAAALRVVLRLLAAAAMYALAWRYLQ